MLKKSYGPAEKLLSLSSGGNSPGFDRLLKTVKQIIFIEGWHGLNGVPSASKFITCNPKPRPSEWDLIQRQGLHRGHRIKMRSAGWGILTERGHVDTGTHKGRTPCEPEGRDGERFYKPRNPKDCQQIPTSRGRSMDQVWSPSLTGGQPCQHPDRGLLASRAERGNVCV